MRKLITILLLIPLLIQAQTPVKITNPYIFNKYTKYNDSTIVTNIKLINGVLPTSPDRPSIAARNDTIFFWDMSTWKAIGSGGGAAQAQNGLTVVNDSVQLGSATGTGTPLQHHTYIGDLGLYDYIIYNSVYNYIVQTEHSIYQFEDSVLNINAPQGAEYQDDISTYIKSTDRGIPDMATVRSVIGDSVVSTNLTTATNTNLTGIIFGNGTTINASAANTYDTTTHVQTIFKNGLATTPSGGLRLENNTASLVGTTVQNSPYIGFKGAAWNTTAGTNSAHNWSIGEENTSAAVSTSRLSFNYALNSASFANVFTISNSGTATAATFVGTGANTFQSTGANTFYAYRLNAKAVKTTGLFLENQTLATNAEKIQNPPIITTKGHQWTLAGAEQIHYWYLSHEGVASTSKSTFNIGYIPDGTTYVPFLTTEGFVTGTTTGTGNSFYLGNGASQTSPQISITSGGKSGAFGVNAANTHIIGDATGNISLGFDSKSNIDGRAPTLASVGLVLNNDGKLYKGTIHADSLYGVSRTAGSALTGTVKYNGRLSTINGAFYGGTTIPTNTDSIINFQGEIRATKITQKASASVSVTIENGTITTTGSSSTSTLASSGTALTLNSFTTPLIINKTAIGSENLVTFNYSGEKAKIDNTGKIFASGGAQLGTSPNYVNINSDGVMTMAGKAKVWDDISITEFKTPTTSGEAAFTTGWAGSSDLGAYYFQGSAQNDIAYFKIQVPHAASSSDSLSFHIHFGTVTTPGAGDTAVFMLTWTPANIGATFPAVSTETIKIPLNGYAQWSHHVASFTVLATGTGTLSRIYVCSIQRLATGSASDTYTGNIGLLGIDPHAKFDSLGSRYETIK